MVNTFGQKPQEQPKPTVSVQKAAPAKMGGSFLRKNSSSDDEKKKPAPKPIPKKIDHSALENMQKMQQM